MDTVMITAALLAGGAVGLLTWSLGLVLDPTRRRALANLNRGLVRPGRSEEEAAATAPRRNPLSKLAHRLTPSPVKRVLDRQYLLAGRPMAWPIDRLVTCKMLWVPVGLGLALLLLGSDTAPLFKGVLLVAMVVVYFLPELLLNSQGQKRNETIALELADTLDQMLISVEAGLGFDAAMSMAARSGKGPLADELKRTFQDIQIGRSRRQAFEALTQRTTVPDLRRFVRAVIQADAYGISITDVLRTQSSEMRLKRRQRAEEKAQKIPVLVLMPLMLFILPVLFIVVLGPAVMGMVEAFSGI